MSQNGGSRDRGAPVGLGGVGPGRGGPMGGGPMGAMMNAGEKPKIKKTLRPFWY
jgi:hypothetical protein